MGIGDSRYIAIGRELKTIREEQGVDLQKIHRETGISMVKLMAIEDGDLREFKMGIAELNQCIALYAKKLGSRV